MATMRANGVSTDVGDTVHAECLLVEVRKEFLEDVQDSGIDINQCEGEIIDGKCEDTIRHQVAE